MLQGAAGDLILFDSSLYHAGCPAEDPTGTTGGQRLPLGSVLSFSPYIPRLRRTPDCNSQWGSELQGQWSDAGFVLTLLPMSRHGPEHFLRESVHLDHEPTPPAPAMANSGIRTVVLACR